MSTPAKAKAAAPKAKPRRRAAASWVPSISSVLGYLLAAVVGMGSLVWNMHTSSEIERHNADVEALKSYQQSTAETMRAVAQGFQDYVKANEVERSRQRDSFLENKARADAEQAAILTALGATSEELLEAARKLRAAKAKP